MVLDFEAFDVLTADVDDEVNVGAEIRRRLEVGNSLNDTVVNGETCLDEVLAVACYGRAFYGNIGVEVCINFLDLICNFVKRLTEI